MAFTARARTVARVSAVVLGLGGGAIPACVDMHGVLTQLVEARRLSADLRLQFTKATEAGNRAVMADTDDASASAAREARNATDAVVRDVEVLRPLLRSLAYADEQRFLDAFTRHFAEFRRLDVQILPLAVENTNLKAQRLLFGPARAASDEFRRAADAAAASAQPADARAADALAARAGEAVLEIQVLLGPHIAETGDAAMTELEALGARSEKAARDALDGLAALVSPAGAVHVAAARAALDRFTQTAATIVALSRRNSNVRSLALSLGRKRIVTVQCDEQLHGLEDALSKHEFTATR